MKKLFLTSIVLISTLTFLSCKEKNKDTERPVINLKAPEQNEAIKPGSDIHFEVILSDNIALKDYKVNIHGAFNGHTHNHSMAYAESDHIEFNKTWLEEDFIKAGARESINGKKEANIHHHYIKIPADINGKQIKEGKYHFMIYCTDQAGNEAVVARDIEISYSAQNHDHHHEH